MKVLTIKSHNSDHTLAEIRTDGRLVEFIVDNTNGKLSKLVGREYSKLEALLANSSVLYSEEPKVATAHLVRYVLDNGDVAEITTDGRTCLLNGKMLTEEEKVALFNAIRTGELKVAHKADRERPVPVLPPMQSMSQPQKQTGMDKDITSHFKSMLIDKEKDESNSDIEYDHEIENADLSSAEDPAYTKRLMYLLKYGEKRG
jgi:hypothetical protein